VEGVIVSLIVAMDAERVIGRGGGLPWDLPEDRAYFRRTTMGHPVIMGRKTYDSIGSPLKGRRNIVLSRSTERLVAGATVVASPDEALAAAGRAEEVFVIGGAEVYALFLPMASRLYVTQVSNVLPRPHGEVTTDEVRFPEVDWDEWRLVQEQTAGDSRPDLRFCLYERRPAAEATR